MQPLNAIAVRPPANTPTAAGSAAATVASNEPATAESLGWQLRAALPPLRLHSVSLYDEEANVLWLSEGALGPDEHNVVVEAIDALGSDTTLNCYESGMEDGRIAIFLPVRSPQGGLVGLAMILADIKSVGDGVVERMVTPQVRTIMQKVAVLLRPAQPRSGQGESTLQVLALAPGAGDAQVVQAVSVTPLQAADKSAAPAPAANFSLAPSTPRNGSAAPAMAPAPAMAAAPTASVNRAQPPVLSPQAVDDILEFELTPNAPAPVPQTQTQRVAALSAVNGTGLSLDLDSHSDKQSGKPVGIPTVSAGAASAAAASAVTTATATNPAPRVAAPSVRAVPAAPAATDDSLDLNLPSLQPPTAAPVGGNVAPLPSAIPTAAAAPSGTGTAKALEVATGTSKALSATSTSKTLSATNTSRVLTMPEGMSLIMEVQPFTKLRTGGRTRRYEVLPRSSQPNRVPPGFDKIALQQLLAWMGSNRAAWSLEPTSFTLNLSISTLEDERFPQFVASNLKTHGIAPDNIGFEIAEPLCLQRRAQVERFITLCDKLGCFVIIDDFSLDSSIVSLLRSKALRMVKIDPKLTSVALKDKLAQAMVVAIAQAVKVLGIHCAAKRVESQAALQWLTAIGCDFAQGSALAQVQPLESLGLPPAPTPA